MRISAGGTFTTGTTVFQGPMRLLPTGATGLGAERLLKTGVTVLEGSGRLLTAGATGLELPEKLLTTGAS